MLRTLRIAALQIDAASAPTADRLTRAADWVVEAAAGARLGCRGDRAAPRFRDLEVAA
ncbi:MAG: hypothetical protein ACUVSX_12275 [Aggregatilineales bacterium]